MFKYELAPVPSVLFDEYSQMRKASKVMLIKKLGVQALPGQNVEVQLIDGNDMLYNIVWSKTRKVYHLADNFLKAVKPCQNVEAYVIFDKYDDTSIKTYERNRRAGNVIYPSYQLTIATDLQPRDTVMKNTNNKKKLIQLLCESNNLPNVNMIGEDACIFAHEEADINMISCMLLVIHQNRKSIQEVSDDNDIFAPLCHFIWKWKLDNVSFTMKKSDGSVIDINASALQLGDECKDLLALTECDTTSYPFGKGKISAVLLSQEVLSQPTVLWKSCFHSQRTAPSGPAFLLLWIS